MIPKIKAIIDKGNTFLITSHIDPDGDAIGSAFSLYFVLRSMGKKVTVYLRDAIPYKYEFLPRPADFTREFPRGPFDVIFALDCGNLFRVGDGYERLRDMGEIINIDHHKTNETFGSVNLIDEHASCTAEILFSLYESMAVPVSLEMGLNIYTAILTDTGSFRYENTNSRAFVIAEKMLESGVRPAYVSQMIYNSHPMERFRLLGLVLSSLETFNEGAIAMAHVTDDMFRSAGATKELSDGFVELVKEIRGVEVAALLREVPGGYKVSLRSRGTIDVAEVCNIFGGGGHKNAAGCTLEGSFDEVRNRLKEALHIR